MREFKLIGVSITCPERADRPAPQIWSLVQAQMCSPNAVGVGTKHRGVNYPAFQPLEDAAKPGIISRQVGLLENDPLHRFQSGSGPAGKSSV